MLAGLAGDFEQLVEQIAHTELFGNLRNRLARDELEQVDRILVHRATLHCVHFLSLEDRLESVHEEGFAAAGSANGDDELAQLIAVVGAGFENLHDASNRSMAA